MILLASKLALQSLQEWNFLLYLYSVSLYNDTNLKGGKGMEHWVSIWGNAMSIMENRPESYARKITLRYKITVPMSGTAIRIELDNFTGEEAVSFTEVTLAKVREQDEADPKTLQTVRFGKEKTLKLEAGQKALSEAIDLPVEKGDQLAVSLYFEEFTSMRCGVMAWGPLSQGAYALGNQTRQARFSLEKSREIQAFYFLSRVDLRCEAPAESILCFGDSITAQPWPEWLQVKLMENDQPVGIVRRAVSGSRVLRQYDCLAYASYGLKAQTRIQHELEACGCQTMVLLQGINDLIHPIGIEVNPFRPWSDLPSREELIEGLQFLISIAHQKGMAVLVGTLTPVEGWRTYAPFRETLRQQVNAWIRQTERIEGVLDFDAALRDPLHPTRLAREMDSGDHLHPSSAGHQKMAEIALITLQQLKEKRNAKCGQ